MQRSHSWYQADSVSFEQKIAPELAEWCDIAEDVKPPSDASSCIYVLCRLAIRSKPWSPERWKGRSAGESHHHGSPRVPSVNDEDGSLHPFWRPRGFWEGFEDSDTESEDDVLPSGGDTSDVPDPEPAPRTGLGVLGRRLTNGFKGSPGFLIGNSLGVERSGTNKRRPRIDLAARRTSSQAPRSLAQALTWPAQSHAPRVEKRGSGTSLRSSGSYERPRRGSRRESWRRGRNIPGLKGMQVQYIGLSGVKERLREKKAEKRRDEIRRSIGSRYYVEGANVA